MDHSKPKWINARLYLSIPKFILRVHQFYWYSFKQEEIFIVVLLRYLHQFTPEIIQDTTEFLLTKNTGMYLGGNRDFINDIHQLNSFLVDSTKEIKDYFDNAFKGMDYQDWIVENIVFNLKGSVALKLKWRSENDDYRYPSLSVSHF